MEERNERGGGSLKSLPVQEDCLRSVTMVVLIGIVVFSTWIVSLASSSSTVFPRFLVATYPVMENESIFI